ncbi:AbrB/MazE/SpoVT family DNA-binding domain-containing protein [candidate division KSB1 bacterium]|nr:AbrB/MazE/SpoVT family DNA-binding domain-containing protein [candidate division KSB1 bacterium]NIR69238.1 AbrB/MazE/SpoVT family DNA-binding domain-containing protein [candidate division KSB1 bacterium]NIS27412.1 AbrB/MazE/SpoVT family DNA-binding domain-containing protein [candidate division KSB1 bacterium]NIT74237.1 AbrB/MazE/SpoVT family DNA-binding domain-containing protein [candidate division KSB1 bacterium]NIU28129.1 AbrB/MazE/SpoVT family DNA-binding domain-containing protein [candid
MPFTKLGHKGRVVIPAELRKKFNLKVGDNFEIKEENGHIVLIPQGAHQTWAWTTEWAQKVEGALKEVEKGEVSRAYDNLDEALKELKKRV